MKATSTLWRFLVPVTFLIAIGGALLATYETALQLREVETDARSSAHELSQLLSLTESIVGEQVKSSLRLLKQRGLETGQPAIHGSISIDGNTTPNLVLGYQPQAFNFDLVDNVSSVLGCTATLFVKSGDDFVRVSTNIKRADGSRATLTKLDPNGKAIKALRQGQPFYGVADILGTPYITGYEPMFDDRGTLIGAWYVGYQVDMEVPRASVEKIRFLDSGFSAVIDYNGQVRFHSAHIKQKDAETLLHNRPTDWAFVVEGMPDWNFKVMMAYPIGEARAVGYKRALMLTTFGSAIAALLLLLLASQMKMLVYKPLGGDPAMAHDLVKRISAGDLREDGIQANNESLMGNILKMRSNLRSMIEILHHNSERLSLSASVFEHANDAIFITDAQTVVEVNPAFTAITGFTREEATGKMPRELLAPTGNTESFDKLWEILLQTGTWRGETWLCGKSGEKFAAWFDAFAVRNEYQSVAHYVGIFSDITPAMEQQQKLERMAYHDPLTQLPNRALLSDRLQQALARANRSGELIGLCYFDLDGFKPVNDTLGHEAGDQLLVELAQRMRGCLRADDTVARMGGDEFALLLCNLQSADECELTLDRILSSINAPFLLSGKAVNVSASIGYTLSPFDDSAPDTLIRHADQAMYQAKLNGGGQYYLFDVEHDGQIRSDRLKWKRTKTAPP